MKSTVVMAVVVLGLMATNTMAGGKPDPNAVKVESPFKGVVGNVSPASVSVKGEVQLANPDKTNAGGKSKPILRNFPFSIKGAKLTRDGKPCELKDVQKGDTATVTFTTKKDSDKRVVSAIDFSKGGGGADEKPKAGEKKADEKK
ncbi:MAG: hypothetical protein NTY01_13215 [Verrucomicrobia bacterium]|nr:hypothetical protein [Verrucomicrobiota bacterium]